MTTAITEILSVGKLGILALEEMCSRLESIEYESVPHASANCERLTVIIPGDGQDLSRAFRYAGHALAKECNKRSVTGFGIQMLPAGVEDSANMSHDNVHLRTVQAWDVMQSLMVYRVDVIIQCALPEVEWSTR